VLFTPLCPAVYTDPRGLFKPEANAATLSYIGPTHRLRVASGTRDHHDSVCCARRGLSQFCKRCKALRLQPVALLSTSSVFYPSLAPTAETAGSEFFCSASVGTQNFTGGLLNLGARADEISTDLVQGFTASISQKRSRASESEYSMPQYMGMFAESADSNCFGQEQRVPLPFSQVSKSASPNSAHSQPPPFVLAKHALSKLDSAHPDTPLVVGASPATGHEHLEDAPQMTPGPKHALSKIDSVGPMFPPGPKLIRVRECFMRPPSEVNKTFVPGAHARDCLYPIPLSETSYWSARISSHGSAT
jgi:hypothetical protein